MSAKLNVGILGGGWFGRGAHLANLARMDDVSVVALSSRSEDSRQQAKQMAGDGLLTVADWHEVLTLDELDAVVIALTNDEHHAAAVAAFEAGKHVLCEKPLGLTVAQCDDILAAAAAAGKVLQVGHEMRYQRLYQRLRELIADGAVGDLHLMWCREFRGPMRPGWRSSQALTGGALLEKSCHHFDLFNWVLETPPLRVAAMGGRNVLLDREIDDNAFVLIEHAGGRRAVLELCLFAPVGSEVEIGVAGSKGRIDSLNQEQKLVHHRFDQQNRRELTVADHPQEAGFVDGTGHVNRGVYQELREFVDCCRTGATPLVDGKAGRLSVAVSLAAQESIRRGEMVTLEETLST